MFARLGLPSFDYVRASTADEVVAFLQERGEAARLMMGGTDLFPGLRDGLLSPELVVDVKHLPGMRDITYDEETGLFVGAAVTMNQLVFSPDVQTHYPLLAEAAKTVASYQIRNRATIGGNVCNASPCADTSPATLLLDASFVLYGPAGERAMASSAFFLGPGKTALLPGEYMVGIRFPPAPPKLAARYHKLGRCRAGDLALVGVAVCAFPSRKAPGYEFRIGLGSVAPTPIRAVEAEAMLADDGPSEEAFCLAAEKAMAAASPISDVRGTADYQRATVRTLALRGLRDVWAQIMEAN